MNDLLLHLASFVALTASIRHGRRGAFESAADELRVDRSVLRRRIQTLTAWAQTPLLRGRGPTLAPTVAGERLAERARVLVADAAALADDVRAARDRVTVACTGTVTTELLPHVLVELERLDRRPAAVKLVVRRAGGSLCEQLVLEGGADVGVVRAERAPQRFAAQLLAEDRLWLAVPAAHALARGTLTHVRLASAPLVLFGEGSRTRARVMDRLAPHGATIRVEVDGRASALAYVRAGLGATFLSLLTRHRPTEPSLVFRDVTALFPPSRFWIVCRPDRRAEPAIDRVIALLARHARHA